MLAQALNLPTSVKLARTKSVDMRLFSRPPRLPPTNVGIVFRIDSSLGPGASAY